MTNPFVHQLNDIGFRLEGEEKTVSEVREFDKETTKTEITNSGTPTPVSTTTPYATIIFEDGGQVEMKIKNIRSMIKHAREHQS